MALRRASAPGRPRSRAAGHPMTALAGRATTGPRTTMPTSVARAPMAVGPNTPLPEPVRATSTTATPMAVRARPATTRRVEAVDAGVVVSRKAARGGTRDARRAGAGPGG